MSLLEQTGPLHLTVSESWGTLFQKKVSITEPKSEKLSEGSFAEELKGDFLSVEIGFSGDLEGSGLYLLPIKDALTMTGMMMSMGSDDALIESTREGQFGDDEKDGLKEIFSQLCGTGTTFLRDQLSVSTSLEVKSLDLVTLDGKLESRDEEDTFIRLNLELEGFAHSAIFLCLSSSLIQEPAPVDLEVPASEESLIDLEKVKYLQIRPNIILAERNMSFDNLIKIRVGSVIEFWKPSDDPAELCVGDTTFANGEVVLTKAQAFGLRILEISPEPSPSYNSAR